MYVYKYVKVNLSKGMPPKKPNEDYHEIIDKHAKEGWRMVQIFAPVVDVGPFAAYYEIIFEREDNQ
ncbi:MAG: DUF4177 domain-containing protein [Muricomes sp.]